MTTNIYVLQLEENKWYVGKAANVEARYEQHLNGRGSAWTRRYAPIALTETLFNVSPFEEDKKTKELMAKYGVKNVRGGTYVTEELTPEQILGIKQEIWGAKNCCTRCGYKSHFVYDCNAKKDVDGETIYDEVWVCEKCGAEFDTELLATRHEKICGRQRYKNITSLKGSCFRCGRPGHYADNCYARIHVNRKRNGYYSDDSYSDNDW